jgi:multicomponent Na+:H+ antiporter subunit A
MGSSSTMKRKHSFRHQAAYWLGRLSALLPLSLFLWLVSQVPHIKAGGSLAVRLNWIPSLGIRLDFVVDGLGLLFGLIISGIGFLIAVYADGYMHGKRSMGRFYFFLHAFLLSMLGLVLSNHLLVMFVFWELTTLFSFLLIGFEHESAAARSSARQAMLVTGGGGLALLVGILLVEYVTGTYTLTELNGFAEQIHGHRLYLPMMGCMLAGAFTKSAQFPFHFWLPNAMSAPTPISAFLHSATMVKAGIYLLARIHPIMGGTAAWMTTLVAVGAVTAVWGSIVALAQTDLKRILAYTTIMALGIITMFLGGRTTPALTAAVTFILVHALYKSSLFMVAGAIDHQTGTREIREIGGLGKTMPFTAAAAFLAAMSMAGFPLFLGFIGKEIMYKGALTEEVYPGLATTAALISNALMVAVAATLFLRPFWGKPGSARPHGEAAWQMWSGPLLLGLVSIGFGLIPDWVGRTLVEPAVLAFHASTEDIRLALFHGINEPLLLSMTTIALGSLAYLGRRRLRRGIGRVVAAIPFTMHGVYDNCVKAVVTTAKWQTRILQSGSLFYYLVIIIGAWLLLVGWALLSTMNAPLSLNIPELPGWLALLLLAMTGSIVIVILARSRLLAICGLGVIGAGLSVIFISLGAPDVGLTQMLVETLTLIIVAIVLLRLPPIRRDGRSHKAQRALRLSLAAAGGALVAGLLISVNQLELDRTITAFYEQAGYLKAHGRNIVNVILVDFRSLDTMGEIIVVAASAIAAGVLIRRERKTP